MKNPKWSDADKMLVVMTIPINGIPKPDAPIKLAMQLFDWEKDRAERALAELHLAGFVSPE